MSKEIAINESSFFKELSQTSKTALAKICTQKSLTKKETLFNEGDNGHAIYLCVRGHVQLYRPTEDGREVAIKVVKPGEVFAEVVLFEKSTYPVSARALEKSILYEIPKSQILGLLDSESFRNDFIANLMIKQRYLVNQIKYLTTHDVEDRLLLFIKELMGNKTEIKTSISKKDVAAAISTTPETLSRVLQRLKKENSLIWEENIIQLK